MTCDDMQLEISAYIDDALTAEGQGNMFAHLGTCPGCREFLRSVLEIRQRIAASPAPEVPAGLDRRVLSPFPGTVRQAGKSPGLLTGFWTRRFSVPVPSVALFALALIAVTLLSFSLLRQPTEVLLPCLPAVDVYAEQPANPAQTKER